MAIQSLRAPLRRPGDVGQNRRPRKPLRSELRLALAMRGGVSLAVWIGGACAEIDALRRAGQPSRKDPGPDEWLYKELLDAAGYRSVSIDVISGASAGGLNGVILSTSIVYGPDFAAMRDVWINLADVELMLRDPRESHPLSLFMGDKYFLRELRAALVRMVEHTSAPMPGQRLDLSLSATLVRPARTQSSPDPSEQIVEPRYGASFHFRHHGPSECLSDFMEPKKAAHRLAIAGRATSSFPVAFEPARITARRPLTVGQRPADPDDMAGIFSEVGESPIDVIDGGVLDNIPIERAIESIQSAPATGPTDRWLLFLHPSPEGARDAPLEDARPRALPTALGSLGIKSNTESLLRDVQELELHNQKAAEARHLREHLLQAETVKSAIATAEGRYEAYRKLRGTYAAEEIVKLLSDPVGYLGVDLFPRALEPPLLPKSRQARKRLQEAIEKARTGHLPASAEESSLQLLDLGAISRLTDLLLEWFRHLEECVAVEELDELGRLKGVLYEIKTTVDLLYFYDAIYWVAEGQTWAGGAQVDYPQRSAAAFVSATAILALHPEDAAAAILVRGLEDRVRGDTATFDLAESHRLLCQLDRQLADRITSVLPPGTVPQQPEATPGGSIDVRVGLSRALEGLILAAPRPASAPDGESVEPIFEVLDGGVTDGDEAVRLSWALEVITFPVTMVLPPTHRIEFKRVSAANATPLKDHFPGGREQPDADGPRWKLAGNDLFNFAAFYKASWRANDWMWGRLDAAVSLIDLLVMPDRLRELFPGEAPKERANDLIKRLEKLTTHPVDLDRSTEPERAQWSEHFGSLWERHRTEVEREATSLFTDAADAGDLPAMRRLLAERRQWDVLVSELPGVIEAAAKEEDPELVRAVKTIRLGGGDPLRDPRDMQKLLREYRVGEEAVTDDLRTRKLTRVGSNLARVTWNAVEDSLPSILRPIGWVIGILRLIGLTVARAPRWALAVLPVAALVLAFLAFTGPPFGIGRLTFALLSIATAAVLYFQARFDRVILVIAALGLAVIFALRVQASFSLSLDGDGSATTQLDVSWIPTLVVLLFILWIIRRLPYPRRAWVTVLSGIFGGAAALVVLLPTPAAEFDRWIDERLPTWGEFAAPFLLVIALVGLPPIAEASLDWAGPRAIRAWRNARGTLFLGVIVVAGYIAIGASGASDLVANAYTAAAAFGLGLVATRGRQLLPTLGLSSKSLRRGVPFVVRSVILGAIILAVWAELGYPGVEHVTPGARAIRSRELAWILFRIFAITAVCEELIFRGALWSAFEREGGQDVALLFTSALYALWHIGPSIDASGLSPDVVRDIGFTLLLGLLFGRVRQRTGGIAAGVAIHFVLNAIGAVGYYLSVTTAR